MNLDPPRREAHRSAPQPAVAGLGPDSLARLTPEQISARSAATTGRHERSQRRATARQLAEQVAAIPPPKRPAPTPTPTPAKPAVESQPWRDGGLVISLDRPKPRPSDLSPEELGALDRLMKAMKSEVAGSRQPHRYADRQTF